MGTLRTTCGIGALSLLVMFSASTRAGAQWSESWDRYANGSRVINQGGWTGWANSNDIQLDARVTADQAFSPPHSVALGRQTDVVRTLNLRGGQWTIAARVFIPSSHRGDTWFIVLNRYQVGGFFGFEGNWSSQIRFSNGNVTAHGGTNFLSPTGVSMPLEPDAWAELRIDVDLDRSTQAIYYNGELLHRTVWQYDGVNELRAIDLFSNNGTVAYFDDISIERASLKEPGPDCVAFADSVPYRAGGAPLGLITVDVDGDGLLDLASANGEPPAVAVLRNAGDGRFLRAQTYRVEAPAFSLVAADVDGDGKKDLAAAGGGANIVSLLRNRGDGTFATADRLGVPGAAHGVTAADLDKDGDPELIVVGETRNAWVLENDGAGSFTMAHTLTTGSDPRQVVAADLDDDGDVDLATVNNNSTRPISILLNGGDGIFAPAVHLELEGELGGEMIAADLDDDGDIDLAGTSRGDRNNPSSSTVWVYRNEGDADFSLEVFTAGSVVQTISSGDLDGDGHLDLVVAGAHRDVWVLRNDREGGFDPVIGFTAGDGPTGVVVAALDGDAAPDIAVTNVRSSDVSVLVNKTDPAVCGLGGTISEFIRGDCNDDGKVDIADAVCTLEWLFLGRETPRCVAATNTNGDGAVQISDAVALLGFLFAGGAPPAAPYPGCGASDLEADRVLGCRTAAGCRP